MNLKLTSILAAIALTLLTRAGAVEPSDGMERTLDAIRDRHHLPALAAIAMIDGKVQALAAAGVRKEGAPVKVTVDDCWQIGSDTKSMTATLAAIFVEKGWVKWETTVADVFPEMPMKPAWRGVTLEQLLTHRAGAPGDAPPDLWVAAWRKAGTPTEQRLALIKGLVSRDPEAAPGTKFIYSNQGYAIAGGMLERIAKKPWEDLMREMLFVPLGMSSAGFGAPGSPGKIDEPWGHTGNGKDRKPEEPGPNADNPPAIGPAAAVHCSLTDLARYAAMHAAGEQGGSSILKADGFVKLHTPPPGGDYAMGWVVLQRRWAGGTTLAHAGSNTFFYVVMHISPAKKAVFIAATNSAGHDAEAGTDAALGALIKQFLP